MDRWVAMFSHVSLAAVSSIGYSLWLRLPVAGLLLAWLWTVLVDCLALAGFVATVLWWVPSVSLD